MTAEDIPGENFVASIADDQPILVPVGGEIRHQAEPVALLAAADRETLREARRRITLRTEPLPPVFDPLESDVVFAHYELGKGDVDGGAWPRRTSSSRAPTASATRSSCTSRTTR